MITTLTGAAAAGARTGWPLLRLRRMVQNGSGSPGVIPTRGCRGRQPSGAGIAMGGSMSTTRGVLYVHSAPSALCPHVEWAVGGVFGTPVRLDWIPQPVERASYRTEYSWSGPAGTAGKLASALKGWQRLRFEVTEEATAGTEAERYSYTPTLGIFHAITGIHGDILIPEDRIKQAMATASLGRRDLTEALDELLGKAWDSELEPFRYAGDGAPVRWLHEVV